MTPRPWLLTVLGKDRPGIIAAVTGVLYRHGCNLEDISMTVLAGEFAMILAVSLAPAERGRIERGLSRACGRDLGFFWKPFAGRARRGEAHAQGTESYLVTAVGRDRTGIVYRISRALASAGLNITDLNSRILGPKGRSIYAMMLEVDIPRRKPLAPLRRALERVRKSLGIEVSLKPVERVEL